VVDVRAEMVCWSELCEGSVVDVMVVMVCWG